VPQFLSELIYRMKKILQILLISLPLSISAQTKTALIFSGGVDSKSVIYNFGVSLTKPYSNELDFKIDLSIKGARFENAIEGRFGVEGNSTFSYFHVQRFVSEFQAGLGVIHSFKLSNNDKFGVGAQIDFVTNNLSLFFNVVSPF
jgi:hypothetical protein